MEDNQLIPYRKKDKWGFCTPDKKIVIDCVWDYVKPFVDEFSRVEFDGKYGFVNKTGNLIIPCIYDHTSSNSFLEELIAVEFNGKFGFIDKANRLIVPFIYEYAYSFNEDVLALN